MSTQGADLRGMFQYFWSLLHLVSNSSTADFFMVLLQQQALFLPRCGLPLFFVDFGLFAVIFVAILYVKT